jgi:hypothetical protein
VLDASPAACGYAGQCGTLARVAEPCWRRFKVKYTPAGMGVLLQRTGWSVQAPARRAGERDEEKTGQMAGGYLAGHKSAAADLGAWLGRRVRPGPEAAEEPHLDLGSPQLHHGGDCDRRA